MGNRHKTEKDPRYNLPGITRPTQEDYFPEHHCTIGFFGPEGVGKSSIFNRLTYNTFFNEYHGTLTPRFEKIQRIFMNETLDIDLIDLSGNEKFRSLNKLYLKKVDAIMLVYAIDDKDSLEQLKERMNEISNAEEVYNKSYIKMIVGNKTDNYLHQQIRESDVSEYAKNNKFGFISINCKNDNNDVEFALEEILRMFTFNR